MRPPLFEPDQPAEQHRQADNHREGVGVQVARLQLPHNTGEPTHRVGRPVDEHTVDQQSVALLPEHAAERPASRGKALDVQIVEVVLAIEQNI